ncbi:MAG: twin-arginine translocase TatA/TatE family subunit [Flavobacteriaceae bacterium]|nr:twin-arginine translocase TatA/TatE family subunit [Flavobacteriaceae bacterium]
MGSLGLWEIIVIFLVVLLLFGPKKIPQIARELGQGIRKLKGAMEDIKQEIVQEDEGNAISEIQQEIEKLKQQVEENQKNKK